jgi:hypothetical protein
MNNGHLYYIWGRLLESMGWIEQCPTPNHTGGGSIWWFYHPTYGTHRFHTAVNIQLNNLEPAD